MTKSLGELSPALQALGYSVETGKAKAGKIFRPVLFGENGIPEVNYEIDAFHDDLGIAMEVEAGRGAAGNADYRDRQDVTDPGRAIHGLAHAYSLPHHVRRPGAGDPGI